MPRRKSSCLSNDELDDIGTDIINQFIGGSDDSSSLKNRILAQRRHTTTNNKNTKKPIVKKPVRKGNKSVAGVVDPKVNWKIANIQTKPTNDCLETSVRSDNTTIIQPEKTTSKRQSKSSTRKEETSLCFSPIRGKYKKSTFERNIGNIHKDTPISPDTNDQSFQDNKTANISNNKSSDNISDNKNQSVPNRTRRLSTRCVKRARSSQRNDESMNLPDLKKSLKAVMNKSTSKVPKSTENPKIPKSTEKSKIPKSPAQQVNHVSPSDPLESRPSSDIRTKTHWTPLTNPGSTETHMDYLLKCQTPPDIAQLGEDYVIGGDCLEERILENNQKSDEILENLDSLPPPPYPASSPRFSSEVSNLPPITPSGTYGRRVSNLENRPFTQTIIKEKRVDDFVENEGVIITKKIRFSNEFSPPVNQDFTFIENNKEFNISLPDTPEFGQDFPKGPPPDSPFGNNSSLDGSNNLEENPVKLEDSVHCVENTIQNNNQIIENNKNHHNIENVQNHDNIETTDRFNYNNVLSFYQQVKSSNFEDLTKSIKMAAGEFSIFMEKTLSSSISPISLLSDDSEFNILDRNKEHLIRAVGLEYCLKAFKGSIRKTLRHLEDRGKIWNYNPVEASISKYITEELNKKPRDVLIDECGHVLQELPDIMSSNKNDLMVDRLSGDVHFIYQKNMGHKIQQNLANFKYLKTEYLIRHKETEKKADYGKQHVLSKGCLRHVHFSNFLNNSCIY